MKEIMCYDMEVWSMSLSMLFGKSPKVKIICGNCKSYFSRKFDLHEMTGSAVRTTCPSCRVINKIPIGLSSL